MRRFVKILTLAATAAVLFSLQSSAQNKGAKYAQINVGGSIYTSSDNVKSWSMGVAPEYGVFVAKNFSVGGYLGVNYGQDKVNILGFSVKDNNVSLDLAGVARYNVPLLPWLDYAPTFYLGVTAVEKVWNESGSYNSDASLWTTLHMVGFNFNLRNNWAINFNIVDLTSLTYFGSNKPESEVKLRIVPSIGLRINL